MDWGSSFSPAWAAGNTSGTANNINGSGINCSVNILLNGSGTLVAPYPRVNSNNSNPADFQVQNSNDAIEIDINLANKTSYYTVSINFSAPLRNVSFAISDIDRPGGGTPWTYSDYVIITGTGPSGSFLPNLSLYNPLSLIFSLLSNCAMANNSVGGGNVGSLAQGIPAQNGTVMIDFGANDIQTINIVYGTQNIWQVNNNPGLQAIAIGNIAFDVAGTLPLQLLSFDGNRNKDGVLLDWQTINEDRVSHFEIEKEMNGDFVGIGTVQARGFTSSATGYNYLDRQAGTGLHRYRLKMIDTDGSFTYSRIIMVNSKNDQFEVMVLGNPVEDELRLRISPKVAGPAEISVYDVTGRLIDQVSLRLEQGINDLSSYRISGKPAGQYLLRIRTEDRIFTAWFLKK